MQYQPALDGLRALAVIAVVACHSWVESAQGGYVGVDLFFVLSGYLITLVLNENSDLRRFYIRRAKRLIPALALMLAAYLAAFPFLVPDHPHLRDAALAFFYLTDFSFAFFQTPQYLGHTWSLSIEEHFYILWPLILLRLKPPTAVLVGAFVLVTVWRWNAPDWMEAYYRFDMRSSGLILGCILARLPRDRIPSWPGLLALLVLVMHMERHGPLTQGPGILVAELAAAVAIIGRPLSWLSAAPLVYLGRLSYGIYLWHFPLAVWMHQVGFEPSTVLVATLGFSVAMAAVSYHTVEAACRSTQSHPKGLASAA